MAYTTQELATMFKISKRTLERRLRHLKQNNQFVKTHPGVQYNEIEAMELAKLLGYNYELRQTPPLFNLSFR